MASFTDDDIEQRQRLLDEWVQTRREIALLEARAAGLMNERLAVLDADVRESPFHRDAIHRSMIAEYSAAGRMSTGSVEYAFTDTRSLHNWLPVARAAFEAGEITAAHVREIVRAGGIVREAVIEGRVDAETLTLFDTAATVAATGDTPARTRALVRQIAATLAGETLVDRHTRARGERAVTMRPAGDGLALLMVVLPEYLATAIVDRLTRLAHEIIAARDDQEPALDPDLLDDGPDPIYESDLDPRDDIQALPGAVPAAVFGADDSADTAADAIFGESDTFTTDPYPDLAASSLIDPLTDPAHSLDIEHYPADTRGIDEIRADLLTDLLLASDPTAAHGTGLDNITARIQVTVAATTITDDDDRPAELDGHGPLHPDAARALAGRSTIWTRLFTRPHRHDHRNRHLRSDCEHAATSQSPRSALPIPRMPHARRTGARSTTITTTPKAARPRSATSRTSAQGTTSSNIPTSMSDTDGTPAFIPTAASAGPAHWATPTSTAAPRRVMFV